MPSDGVVLTGHGSECSVRDVHDQHALSSDNVRHLWARWGHAIACRAGVELPGWAVHHGWHCFVGYDAPLLVEFQPAQLPPEMALRLATLVTTVSAQLAQGVFERAALRRHASQAADDLVLWIDDFGAPEHHMVRVFAESLTRLLVVRVPEA